MKRRTGVRRACLLVIAVAAAGAIIHELAHLAAAWVLGISIVSFSPFDSTYLSPAIRISPDTDFSLRTSFWYAGGVTAGAVMFLPLALARKWFLRSTDRWALGLSLSSLGLVQLGLGFMEGALHGLYIEGAGTLGSANSLAAAWCAVMGFLVYVAVFPRPGGMSWKYRTRGRP